MNCGSSSSWDAAPRCVVAPEVMAIDDEGSVQLTLGQEFVNELLEWYFRGVMNAHKVCVLCHRTSLCGVSEAAPYAHSPASQSGKFQRKLDAALGMEKEDDDFYTMETPLLCREDHERVQEAMLVNPPHESLAREVAESPDLLKSWSRKILSEPWVQAHERNPLVQSASREERPRILLVALYMDVTRFAKRDSLFRSSPSQDVAVGTATAVCSSLVG